MATGPSVRVSNSLIGAAGVHWVASELSRRGLIAMPTIGNAPGIDLLVAEPDGSGVAAMQVKTAGRVKIQEEGRQWWPMSAPDMCLRGSNAFYVFVRWREDLGRFEAFLDGAAAVASQVQLNLEGDRRLGRTDFPSWGLPSDPKEQDRLAANWQNWCPPRMP